MFKAFIINVEISTNRLTSTSQRLGTNLSSPCPSTATKQRCGSCQQSSLPCTESQSCKMQSTIGKSTYNQDTITYKKMQHNVPRAIKNLSLLSTKLPRMCPKSDQRRFSGGNGTALNLWSSAQKEFSSRHSSHCT
jgi:hypothetical protein